jgi:uncharacterized protein (TIGR00269 family)
MKCTRCRERAEVHLRAHNSAFCRPCFIGYFRRHVERAITHEQMFTRDDRLLVAVSGGKDSLALWDVLIELGYTTTGLYLGLGIGEYSDQSQVRVEAFAAARNLPLVVRTLADEGPGLAVPSVARSTRRVPCAACGAMKRHFFDAAAHEGGFDVLVTGHNLDDEAARLLGNVLRWQRDRLARQRPVLEARAKFVRKVKPLYLLSEYETAVYAFMRRIDYVVEECPNAAGATQLLYKDALNRLEVSSPGTKLAFVKEFVRTTQRLFAVPEATDTPGECLGCGMPAYGALCSFCSLVREVEAKRARQSGAPLDA